MFELVLIVYFGYDNFVRAKQKGQKPLMWVLLTIVAFFITEMMGAFFVLLFFLRNKVNFSLVSTDLQYKNQAVDIIGQEFKNNPMLMVCIYLFGVSGYLLIRYILEQKNEKKNQNVHWMDKLNNNSES